MIDGLPTSDCDFVWIECCCTGSSSSINSTEERDVESICLVEGWVKGGVKSTLHTPPEINGMEMAMKTLHVLNLFIL